MIIYQTMQKRIKEELQTFEKQFRKKTGPPPSRRLLRIITVEKWPYAFLYGRELYKEVKDLVKNVGQKQSQIHLLTTISIYRMKTEAVENRL